MSLTSHSELYGAVHDAGVNTIIRHLMRQRPSLFNYGTEPIARNLKLLCRWIEASPGVTELISVLPAIPLLPTGPIEVEVIKGTIVTFSSEDLFLDYVVQVTDLQLDFHPGNAIRMPKGVGPLKPHTLSFRAKVCAGVSCTPRQIPGKQGLAYRSGSMRRGGDARPYRLADFQAAATLTKLQCFCIELFGTAHGTFEGMKENQRLTLSVDRLELQDIAPEGLENAMECYMHTLLEKVILPTLTDVMAEIIFKTHEIPGIPTGSSTKPADLGTIQIAASTAVANNPAIEDNQLKLFLNMDQFTLVIPQIVIGSAGGGTPPLPRVVKSRVQTGPATITTAVSEAAFREAFGVIRDAGRFDIVIQPQTAANLGVKGSFSARIRFHLANGSVSFNADNTIGISELDIVWDQFDLAFRVDIPALTIPGPCLPIPFSNPPAFACLPPLGVLFEKSPDFSIPLSLPTGSSTEISLNAGFKTYYCPGSPSQWQVYLAPSRVDLDLVDVADTFGQSLGIALNDAIVAMTLPGITPDSIKSNIVGRVRDLLDFPDDVGEWLQQQIFTSLGVETTIETYIWKYFADSIPVLRVENPVEVLPAEGARSAVKLPIEYLGASVNDDEMIITVDVGGVP